MIQKHTHKESGFNQIFLIFLLLFFFLFSFSLDAVAANPKKTSNTSVVPFIYGISSNIASMDPLGAYDTTSGIIILNCFEGLYAYDYTSESGMRIQPRLAREMGYWNADQTELTIPLRDDVYWWDGTRFTAEDVVWNFDRINRLSEQGINEHASLWLQVDNTPILQDIEAIDTYEVKMTFSTYIFEWEHLLPFWGASMIQPNLAWANNTASLNDFSDLVGTGPFMPTIHDASNCTVLSRFDDYYRGRADIAEIQLKYYPDSDTLSNAFLEKELHLLRSINEESYLLASDDPLLHTEVVLSNCLYFFNMNVNNIPWEVRKAMQYAFNYSVFPDIYGECYPVHHHPIPVGMEGYNPELPGLPYFDLAKARQYLLNSPNLEIQDTIMRNNLSLLNSTEEWRNVALSETPIAIYDFTFYGTTVFYDFLYESALDIGVYVGLNIIDWPYWPDSDFWKSQDFSIGGWCPDYCDPFNMLEPLFHSNGSSNFNGLANASIDANIEALKQVPVGSNVRSSLIDSVVTQIIVEQAAVFYVMGLGSYIAWNQEMVVDGTEGLLNPQGITYFYPIDFLHSEAYYYRFLFISGYNLLALLIVFGITAVFVVKHKQKQS